MVHPMHDKKRFSLSKAPDYSAKRDTEDVLSGKKKTPSEADYKPASNNSNQRCHECMNYGKPGEPVSDCGVVIGIVKAEGVCDMFCQREYDKPGSGVVIEIRNA